MNLFGGVLCVLSLAASGSGQAPDDGASLDRVARAAERQLSNGISELNALHEQINAEKLPLSQRLTASEERLAQVRRDHDSLSRQVTTGTLELAGLRDQVQERQDELAYVANLLDEYAKGFDQKINVSELQYCGATLDAAKHASENHELSAAEKFARQLALADLSLKRLSDAANGMRFAGVGVDQQGTVAEGEFAILGPVALFQPKTGPAGLVVPQSGSTKPLIRPLEGTMQAGIESLLQSGDGVMPLDPSLGGALKALVQKTNLYHIFEKGGPIMWPLLLTSILALGTAVERMIFFMLEKLRRDDRALGTFFAAVNQGNLRAAIEVGKASKFYVVRALGYALAHKEQSLNSALVYAQAQELKRFQRGVPILDTVITLAPLLGLLGTVTGMMGSFSLIGGELGAPGAITGGIAEALIATAFGLGIAITALLPFNYLNAKVEQARHEIESAATQLELLVQQREGVGVAPARSDSAALQDESLDDAARAVPDARVPEREARRRREVV